MRQVSPYEFEHHMGVRRFTRSIETASDGSPVIVWDKTCPDCPPGETFQEFWMTAEEFYEPTVLGLYLDDVESEDCTHWQVGARSRKG